MSTFKVDKEQVDSAIDTLSKLLNRCEILYDKKIPDSDDDKGQTHDEIVNLCTSVKNTCYELGELINNTIRFLGGASEMFEKSDKDSAIKITSSTTDIGD